MIPKLKNISSVKFIIMIFIAGYSINLAKSLTACFNYVREVPIERTHFFTQIDINDTNYNVRSRTEKTNLPLPVSGLQDFLFVSTSEFDECLVSGILKISIGLLLMILFWKVDEHDPFSYQNINLVIVIFALICTTIFAEIEKNHCSEQIIIAFQHVHYDPLRGWNYQHADLITTLAKYTAILGAMGACLKAMKNKRELDLTI